MPFHLSGTEVFAIILETDMNLILTENLSMVYDVNDRKTEAMTDLAYFLNTLKIIDWSTVIEIEIALIAPMWDAMVNNDG